MARTNRLTVSHFSDTGSLKASSTENIFRLPGHLCTTDTHWVHVGTLSKDHNLNAIILISTGAKMITYWRTENLKNHTLFHHMKRSIEMLSTTDTVHSGIFLAKTYSLYMAVPSPRWVFPPQSICIGGQHLHYNEDRHICSCSPPLTGLGFQFSYRRLVLFWHQTLPH